MNHLQFTKWPNYGVPDSVGPISDFIKLVHQKANELEAKDPELVIHCRCVLKVLNTLHFHRKKKII